MMNHQAVSGMLDRLARAFTLGAPDPRGRELWCEVLEPVDHQTALAACDRAITGLDRHPTIHQFLDLCVEVEAEAAEAARPGPDLPPPGPLPAGARQASRDFLVAVRKSLTAGREAAAAGEDVEAVVLSVMAEHRPQVQPDLRGSRCRCDRGWFVEDDGSVRPCDDCLPDTAARWAGGHFELGHSCPECAAVRRG